MTNPCKRCRERDFCQSIRMPCERRKAYLEYAQRCRDVRRHILEVMARAKKEHNL